jgi:hypothetical protein
MSGKARIIDFPGFILQPKTPQPLDTEETSR